MARDYLRRLRAARATRHAERVAGGRRDRRRGDPRATTVTTSSPTSAPRRRPHAGAEARRHVRGLRPLRRHRPVGSGEQGLYHAGHALPVPLQLRVGGAAPLLLKLDRQATTTRARRRPDQPRPLRRRRGRDPARHAARLPHELPVDGDAATSGSADPQLRHARRSRSSSRSPSRPTSRTSSRCAASRRSAARRLPARRTASGTRARLRGSRRRHASTRGLRFDAAPARSRSRKRATGCELAAAAERDRSSAIASSAAERTRPQPRESARVRRDARQAVERPRALARARACARIVTSQRAVQRTGSPARSPTCT